MHKFLSIAGNVVGWGLLLGVMYLSYRYIWQGSLPNFFYQGWGTLQPRYAVPQMPAQRATTSVRVGPDVYQSTMQVALDAQGGYLQVPTNKTMHIPYSRFELLERPKARPGVFSLGTYGIFQVGGVAIWLDNPYASQLITRLDSCLLSF